jgi:hypothetical protein
MFSKVKNAQLMAAMVCLGIGLLAAVVFCAEVSPDQAVVFPKWIKTVLGIIGIAGSGTVLLGARKITKLLTLIADLRSVIDNLVHFFYALKGKIKDPELAIDMNQSIDAMAKILEDTGNQSLIRKAASLKLCKTKIEEWVDANEVVAQVGSAIPAPIDQAPAQTQSAAA